ncbi:MAG TPA: pyridoxamine 5'-phosphate oxidase family protein [Polyangiales bacterium]
MSRDKREHLVDLLKDFDTAMLVTHTAGEAIRARPMHLVQVQEDGSVLFVSSRQGGAAKEISRTADVAVTVQGKAKFASLSGRAKLDDDRGRIAELWRESWKVWFPKGKDDPDIVLLEFDAADGEYWDNAGVKGVEFVVKAAKAYLGGERMSHAGEEQHAKVPLAGR